jgi:drug/metabolite transporter (DMT)-like permease
MTPLIWLIVVTTAYFFYALVFIIDKYILSRSLPHPVAYSFYVNFLSIFILILLPLGFHFPSWGQLILVLTAGIINVAGCVLLYGALNKEEVSRIAPFVGGFVAIFTLILSMLFLNEHFAAKQVIAFVFLVLGCLILSFEKKKFFSKPFVWALISALFFAIFWIITKYIFIEAKFVSGIIWVRTGVALASLLLLVPEKNRKLILKKAEKSKSEARGYFFAGRAMSILGGLGVYVAVYLGSVVLTNAFQGLQYVFVFLFAILFFKKFHGLREELKREIIIQKVLAIILICFGLFILVV